jgi:hypothetical protein
MARKSLGDVCRMWLPGLAIAIAAALSTDKVMAQSTALPAPRNTANLLIVPTQADLGIPRELRVSGIWMNGCAPVGATAVFTRFSGPESTPVVTIELFEPLTLVACTQALTPYEQRVTFTPTVRGRLRVVIVTNLGRYIGESVLDVREANDDRSITDITGVWYDPTTNGSGLTFIHSRVNDNTVFGTWYVYGSNGVARWFTIQNNRWSAQGNVLVGDLYETRGLATSCQPLEACPVPFTSVTVLGSARMSFSDANMARIDALSPTGAVLFSSNLQRIQF